VTVLCPVVVAEPTWLVAGEGTHFAKRRSVRSEAIGDDGFRNEALVLECPSSEHLAQLAA